MIRRAYESEIPYEYRYVTDTPRERSRNVSRTWYKRSNNTTQTSAYRNSQRYAKDTPMIREYVTELLGLFFYLAGEISRGYQGFPCCLAVYCIFLLLLLLFIVVSVVTYMFVRDNSLAGKEFTTRT